MHEGSREVYGGKQDREIVCFIAGKRDIRSGVAEEGRLMRDSLRRIKDVRGSIRWGQRKQ